MPKDYPKIIEDFENKVELLLSRYQALQAENEKLKMLIADKDQQILLKQKQIIGLSSDNKLLAVSNQLSADVLEREKALSYLNSMVREIDNCLNLLNE